MEILSASQLPEKAVRDFLKNVEQIQVNKMLQSGYMLVSNYKINGCFMLEKVGEEAYELKHFYLISTEGIKIPILFEAILMLAKERGAKQIFVRSHKQMTDIILSSLNFYPQDVQDSLQKDERQGGKWWSYTITD